MISKLVILVVCAIALTVGAKSVLHMKPQTESISEWKQQNSLNTVAKRVKAEGKTNAKLPGPDIDYPGVDMDLDEALRQYSALIATPIERKSYIVNSDSITTWYRLRIDDMVSEKPYQFCGTCPFPPSAPADMGTLGPREFMLAIAGGTVVVDGVELTIENHAIPGFEIDKNYLLFVSLSPSGVATLAAGPAGVFHVRGNSLEALTKSDHPITRDITKRFSSSLTRLKASVQP